MLIPMAANLFGIPTEVAMQAVAIGFVISVVQDSTETALNSSTDVPPPPVERVSLINAPLWLVD